MESFPVASTSRLEPSPEITLPSRPPASVPPTASSSPSSIMTSSPPDVPPAKSNSKLRLELPPNEPPPPAATASSSSLPSATKDPKPSSSKKSKPRPRSKPKTSPSTDLPLQPPARYPPLPPLSPVAQPRNYDTLFGIAGKPWVDPVKELKESDTVEGEASIGLDERREGSRFLPKLNAGGTIGTGEVGSIGSGGGNGPSGSSTSRGSSLPVRGLGQGPLDIYLPQIGPNAFYTQAYLPKEMVIFEPKQAVEQEDDFKRVGGKSGLGCLACCAGICLWACTDCCCCC